MPRKRLPSTKIPLMIDTGSISTKGIKFKQLTALFLFSYLGAWLYALLSQFWVPHGGASNTMNYFEYPFILCFSLIISFNPEPRKTVSRYTFVPPLTLITLYLLYDTVYSLIGRSPRVSDIKNLPALYSVSPLLYFSFVVAVLLILSPTLFSFFAWINSVGRRRRRTVLLVKGMLLIVLLTTASSKITYSYQKNKLDFNDWATAGNVKKNGRIASFLYYYNKREDTLKALGKQRHFSIFKQFYNEIPARKRNIHIVILESFIDPREIEHFRYSRSPVSRQLQPFLVGGSGFSLIKTPVYGGGTAQTEFEVLTGIPALARIESIEFNLFEGGKTSSFVQRLNELGYRTIASVATEPVYYNSRLAYQGIGFDEVFFLERDSYFQENGDPHLFDGDFFNANIEYVEKSLATGEGKEPILNYLVGMYGHIPFTRNKELRPDIVSLDPQHDELDAVANQFYYRTRALAEYLEKLQQLDPSAVIFVTSDHLPPIFHQKDIVYKHDLHINSGLLLNEFSAVDVTGKSVYDISHIIWNLLIDSSDPVNNISCYPTRGK
ncbi:MAG: sulfatase-like hydrolase/transferase, partial [Thermodesulfobacteriota bacterium]